MKNYSKLLGILLFVSFLFHSCKKDEINESDLKSDIEEILARNIQEYAQSYPGKQVGLYFAMKNADTMIFAQAKLDGLVSKETKFNGASTTKTFTAAAILRLHQEGKLDIHDRIVDNIPGTTDPYIPDNDIYAIPFKDQITIQQLLSHRAGVFDVTNIDIPDTVSAAYAGMRFQDYVMDQEGETHTFTFDEFIEPISDNQLYLFPPDSAFYYSNSGYHLLGKIVERISGKDLAEYKKETFLSPLDMDNTYFEEDGSDLIIPEPNIVNYLYIDGEVLYIPENNLTTGIADGNIVTTPEDLVTWAYALYHGNEVLNEETKSKMLDFMETNEIHVSYGLGCEAHPEELGYGHNGARVAYLTTMRYVPEIQTAFMIGSNSLYIDDLGYEQDILYDALFEIVERMK